MPSPLDPPVAAGPGAVRAEGTPFLSVVVPVFQEARVVQELVRRCVAAATRTGRPFELLFVDDESRDETPTLLAAEAAADARVRHVRLDRNRGQFGATQEGLRQARGAVVAVLDGDLQDPPEVLPQLVEAYGTRAPDDPTVVFAVKARRQDPLWFRVGRVGYQALQATLGAAVPSGAGSYCLMPSALAKQAAAVPMRHANLAPVLVALGAQARTVPYDKAARYDDHSRVGPVGLAKEALGSLLLLSPAGAARLGPADGRKTLHPFGWGPLLAALAFVLPLLVVAAGRLQERVGATFAHAIFAYDDWEWLWFGQTFERFLTLLDPVGRDVFRPLAWLQYAVFPALFGPTPVPIALFHLALALTGSTLLGLVFRRIGFGWPTALLAALAGWAHPAYMQSTVLLSINEVTLSRTFAAGLWLLFLREVPGRARAWGPLFLAGALSHESFIGVVPVLLVLVWVRGGWAEVRRLASQVEFRRLAALWLGTYAVRVALYTSAPHGSHVLTPQAIERNARFLVDELWKVFGGVQGPGLAPVTHVAFASIAAGLLLSRRERWVPVVVVGWGAAFLWLRWQDPAWGLALAVALWVVGVAWRFRAEAGVARQLAFLVLFPAITYAPFLLQRDYVTAYFLHFAIHGGTLAVAWLLPRGFGGPAWKAVPSALAVAFPAIAWLPAPTTNVLFPDRLPERLVAAVRAQLPPPGEGETTVLFVEFGEGRSVQDGYIELRSPWLTSIGSSFAWGSDGKALDRMNPVPAFDYSFPAHRLRTRVVGEGSLALACLTPADVAVGVRPLPPAPEQPSVPRWDVFPLDAAWRDVTARPPALLSGTDAANAFQAALRVESGDDARAQAVVDGLQAFCDARHGGDRATADLAARRVYGLLRAFPDGGKGGRARDALRLLRALTPDALDDGDGQPLGSPFDARPAAPAVPSQGG